MWKISDLWSIIEIQTDRKSLRKHVNIGVVITVVPADGWILYLYDVNGWIFTLWNFHIQNDSYFSLMTTQKFEFESITRIIYYQLTGYDYYSEPFLLKHYNL